MTRQRARPTCGEGTMGVDEETGHPTLCLCSLPRDHRMDQHYDRKRGHWWPRLDAPTLPAPGPDVRPVDDYLF